jgi:hypothetical protein
LASSVPVCELCGSASRTTTAAESLPGIGPESPAIPTCAPLFPTPRSLDSTGVRGVTPNRTEAKNARAGMTLTDVTRGTGRCPCRCHTSTSSAAASPARTSPTPARAQGSTGSARVFGASTPASFASFDPDTSSWRTSQLCLDGDLDEFSETWPRAGMTRNGTAYRLQPLAPLTKEIGSGSLPTPRANADRASRASVQREGHWSAPSLGQVVEIADGTLPREYDSWEQVPKGALDAAQKLGKWPTPHGMPKPGQHRRPGPSGNELGRAVNQAERQWPTPKAQPSGPDYARANREGSGGDDLATAVARGTPGQLNPTWVEWLMGFPLGWTDLRPSGTPSSPRSPSSSGGESPNGRPRPVA